jgi:hypothetical protein
MRVGGGLLVGALASGAMAAAAMGTAPPAEASCVAAGGWFSIGSGCVATSPGDFALAIGPGATATADGGSNTAIAWGVGAMATATGVHNTAMAIGNAATGGDSGAEELSRVSTRTVAVAGQPTKVAAAAAEGMQPVQSYNTAIAIGNGAQSRASGVRSTAISNGTEANATARGVQNFAYSRGTRATSQAISGRNNTAIAIGNPDVVEGPNTKAELASGREIVQNTTAVAGDLAGAGGAQAPRAAAPDQSSDNNTAIAVGNGTVARAGTGSGNYASALGNRSIALAQGGDRNRAIVRGNDSRAGAGALGKAGGAEASALAAIGAGDGTSNGNTAIAVGNRNTAVAGPGNGNVARVFGSRSTARATGEKQRVTSVGVGVDKPAKEQAAK